MKSWVCFCQPCDLGQGPSSCTVGDDGIFCPHFLRESREAVRMSVKTVFVVS